MIKLYGFSLSNYYNKVKFALLEKGIPFEEVRVDLKPGSAADLAASPLGKVPYIECAHGTLCESQVILDYLEARWPTPPLFDADPWRAAKQREQLTFLDLHLELCARQLYPQAFFGGTLPEKFLERVKRDLVKRIAAVKPLLALAPYAGGEQFSAVDCAAFVHLPLVAMSSKIVYGEDLLAVAGIDWKTYVKRIEQRPAAQRVSADRKADQARLLAGQGA